MLGADQALPYSEGTPSPTLHTLQDHCPDCNDSCPYLLRKWVALVCNSRDLCLQHCCGAITWVQDEGFICLPAMGLLWLQTQRLYLIWCTEPRTPCYPRTCRIKMNLCRDFCLPLYERVENSNWTEQDCSKQKTQRGAPSKLLCVKGGYVGKAWLWKAQLHPGPPFSVTGRRCMTTEKPNFVSSSVFSPPVVYIVQPYTRWVPGFGPWSCQPHRMWDSRGHLKTLTFASKQEVRKVFGSSYPQHWRISHWEKPCFQWEPSTPHSPDSVLQDATGSRVL